MLDRLRKGWWRHILTAGLAALFVYTLLMQVGSSGTRRGRLRGLAAPEFTLPVLGQSTSVTLADLRGKGVVLVFWATHCRSCKQELPLIERLHRTAPDDSVTFLTVAQDEPGKLLQYVKRSGMSVPVLVDAGNTHDAYAVGTIPYTVFIGPDGKVNADIVGPVSWSVLRENVEKLRSLGAGS